MLKYHPIFYCQRSFRHDWPASCPSLNVFRNPFSSSSTDQCYFTTMHSLNRTPKSELVGGEEIQTDNSCKEIYFFISNWMGSKFSRTSSYLFSFRLEIFLSFTFESNNGKKLIRFNEEKTNNSLRMYGENIRQGRFVNNLIF